MSATFSHAIDWSNYQPHAAMQAVVAALNQKSLPELLAQLPAPDMYRNEQVTFDYRVYGPCDPQEAAVVYILLNGYGVPASSPDSGIKELITDTLLEQIETRRYAILVIGGLFAFPRHVRWRAQRRGSGALAIVAESVPELLKKLFPNAQTVTVSGYSLGGVLAPLVARAITEQTVLDVEQVSCGEPNYATAASTVTQLLKRVSRATGYRNEQIAAAGIHPYAVVKKTPETAWAMAAYRLRQYRLLLGRVLSMRLMAKDLAVQAQHHPDHSRNVQMYKALQALARKGIRLNLLHAEHSTICQSEPFGRLIQALQDQGKGQLVAIHVHGRCADHGIEEQRTLSTPFLVQPELYYEP